MKEALITACLAGLGAVVLPFFAPLASAQTMCTMQYDPVCGAQPVQCITTPCYPQYKTYGNACMAGIENATIIHKGECLPHETGPYIPYTPAPKPKPKPPIIVEPPVYMPPVYVPPVYHPPVWTPWWHWVVPWHWNWRFW